MIVKSPELVPEIVGAAEKLRSAKPGFVTVMVCSLDVDPMFWSANTGVVAANMGVEIGAV